MEKNRLAAWRDSAAFSRVSSGAHRASNVLAERNMYHASFIDVAEEARDVDAVTREMLSKQYSLSNPHYSTSMFKWAYAVISYLQRYLRRAFIAFHDGVVKKSEHRWGGVESEDQLDSVQMAEREE